MFKLTHISVKKIKCVIERCFIEIKTELYFNGAKVYLYLFMDCSLNAELAKAQARLHQSQLQHDAVITISEDSGLADQRSRSDSRSKLPEL